MLLSLFMFVWVIWHGDTKKHPLEPSRENWLQNNNTKNWSYSTTTSISCIPKKEQTIIVKYFITKMKLLDLTSQWGLSPFVSVDVPRSETTLLGKLLCNLWSLGLFSCERHLGFLLSLVCVSCPWIKFPSVSWNTNECAATCADSVGLSVTRTSSTMALEHRFKGKLLKFGQRWLVSCSI